MVVTLSLFNLPWEFHTKHENTVGQTMSIYLSLVEIG